MESLGIIAGGGQFPIIVAHTAHAQGLKVYTIAHIDEADPQLAEISDGIEWIHLGQMNRLIKFFQKHNVTDAVMAGTITKTRMFSNIRPDLKALSMLAALGHTKDDGILRAVADLLAREGINIRHSTILLPDLLAKEGCWTKRKPSPAEISDIQFGWRLAKEIGRLDIGQSIVVRDGSVLAVEAIDGTNSTIRRGGMLGKNNTVVVKVSKPKQDMRFDLPATGVETIETMHDVCASLLAIEANQTVVFDRQRMIERANQYEISIVALTEESIGGEKFLD
ncbi:MAG: UDP-2,3-diacylglucosamine diphosphatase LpxI [Pseudomonadota bacterium]